MPVFLSTQCWAFRNLIGDLHRRTFGQALRSACGKPRNMLVALSAVFAAQSAAAGELVPADPWEIIHVAREYGSADVTRDAMRDPKIAAILASEGGASGLHFEIGFYGCELERNCQTILFSLRLEHASWAATPPAAELISAWNREKLFGRAWLDDENHAVLDHAVAMRAGLPKETLRATFEAWLSAVVEYTEHLDFPGS